MFLSFAIFIGVAFAEDVTSNRYIPCKCVPYYQCPNGSPNTDGSNLLDPRKNTPPATDIPLYAPQVTPPDCGNSPDYICCKNTSHIKNDSCGVRNANGVDPRIVNPGDQDSTNFGEYPWQAAVLDLGKDDATQKSFVGAAVLIDRNHCVTAAHIVDRYRDDPSSLLITTGVWNAQAVTEPLPHQNRPVENITIHPNYNKINLKNDIAIMYFKKPIVYASNVAPICLPTKNETHYGEKCIVTGWGKDKWGSDGQYSQYLKKVAVPVLNHSKCESKLRNTRLGPFFNLYRGFICAGGEPNEDSCKGDGGGPMACYRKDGTYSLTGVVSWGINCGQPNVPGVYINVTHYLDWITGVTSQPLSSYWPKK